MRFHLQTIALSVNAIVCALIGLNLGASAASPAIPVVASNWKFTPATVDAHVGQPTTLSFSSAEGVHGLASTDLGIAQTMIMPGKSVVVTFTPQKAGTYPLHCSVVCGAGHEKMMFTVNVAP